MSASAVAPVQAQPTVEQKILDAAAQSEQIVAAFSQPASTLIATGVAVEPVISGLVRMIAGLFKHHAAQAAKK